MSLLQRAEAPHKEAPFGELNNKKFYNICYRGFEKCELVHPDNDHAKERRIAMECNTKDGVKPLTKEEQDAERALNWQLVKKFTMSIFKMSFTNFSFPAGYSEPRTFIERSAEFFSFLADGYIDKAIAEVDPERRLGYIATGVMAGFHLYLQQKKPWNPTLGETYVGRWENGVTCYGEQTCHHPPITNMQIIPDNGKWSIDSQSNFIIAQGMTVNIHQSGLQKLTLSDGTVYEWEFPSISVTGLLSGDRIVKVVSPFSVKDVTNNLEVYMEISPKKSKARGITNPRVTTVWGGIRPLGKTADADFTKTITGDYCDSILVDGEVFWNIAKDTSKRPLAVVSDDDLLPSDGRFRIDRSYLIKQSVAEADKAKTLLEELQRRDAKLRKKEEAQ